jgi:ankyrin repeat protein
MKKSCFAVIVLLILFTGIVYADDYKWDLVNALINDDFQKIETIIKGNIDTMPASEKRLVMNFTLTYSYRETTVKTLNLLLSYNIFPNNFDLYTAINRNQSNTVIQLLLQNGSKANGEILMLTMEKQRLDLAKQFIETGIDVNYQYPLSKNYADGMTPLLYASKWNNFELIKLLVEKGANINVKAKDGNTALTMAQTNGNNEIYNYLIEHGAVEPRNNAAFPSQTQSTGIAGMLDNQITAFQRGTYRLSGGSSSMKFTGNSNSGSISYVNMTNNKVNNGLYRINGNNITISIDGYTFVYKMDSNASFSGNGEIWVRAGN